MRALRTAADNQEPLAYRLNNDEEVAVHALAADTRVDAREDYDALMLDFDRNLENGWAALPEKNEWAPVVPPTEPKNWGPGSSCWSWQPISQHHLCIWAHRVINVGFRQSS